jgi:hypothetical protein
MPKELNMGDNYTHDVQFEINQEVGEHTKECALNMAQKVMHTTCRDCPCHKYKKF